MIAYFLLVHRYPKQFKRLFKAIYHPDNFYVVHTDKRADQSLRTEIGAFLASFPNAQLIESKNALWGGYSLVDAQLRGIAALLAMSPRWQFFINLSGQDFPLKSQRQIRTFLTKHAGTDFMKVIDQQKVRPGTVGRFQNYYLEFAQRIVQLPFTRKFLRRATPYIGNQWMILTRSFCEFLATSPEVTRFKRFYRHTFIADESFFQTVIMNTSYQSQLVNDDLRAIDWVPDGTIKLRPRTFTLQDATYLRSSHNLFARKFDESVDGKILDLLEADLAHHA
ncbi:glycosyl transferase [Patescibacteria group bacterium]|nr:glycosyl transferase [Patescibacteria group bacterium]